MAEQQRSKAGELVDDLIHRPLSEKERARRHPKLPELRLRTDAPTVDIDATTRITDAVEQLREAQLGLLALREPDGNSAAVMLSTERYLELAGKELASDSNKVGTLDGDLAPSESAFAASHVEQVDLNAAWTRPSPI
jgi:hypothetical protein